MVLSISFGFIGGGGEPNPGTINDKIWCLTNGLEFVQPQMLRASVFTALFETRRSRVCRRFEFTNYCTATLDFNTTCLIVSPTQTVNNTWINYLNQCVYKPTVWTFGHLLYNNIANEVQLVLQPGSNKQMNICTLDYFQAAVFFQDFCCSCTYFRIFIKCFSDNRGWVLPPILIVIYKVQKSCDFHFYIDSVSGATQRDEPLPHWNGNSFCTT